MENLGFINTVETSYLQHKEARWSYSIVEGTSDLLAMAAVVFSWMVLLISFLSEPVGPMV